MKRKLSWLVLSLALSLVFLFGAP
ncbi:MAG: hypothetical protein H6Q42_4373, partial [Deltaproteobacteria bacterium]|nr:hypothetical protein [Deltaproteobacteria bacterium]